MFFRAGPVYGIEDYDGLRRWCCLISNFLISKWWWVWGCREFALPRLVGSTVYIFFLLYRSLYDIF